ncbi:hypothetical protein N657DRAFT_324324 [Parathielavia appendiculata]|uniref:Transposase n=1 Tax=Parathielavia appendiculata TaxID=2587402 RepID=A0AAN6YZ06_9PEZI|nr:hypothetical protein N657DRAFT_324324 [Parathielavia appendiculata]
MLEILVILLECLNIPKTTCIDLQVAISAIKDRTSIRRAASNWGILFSTLQSPIKSGHRPKGEYEALAL